MRLPTLATSFSTIAALTAVSVLSACGPSNPNGRSGSNGEYQEYSCPPPIGKIVREDCSKSALQYDGVKFAGSAGVANAGVKGSYEESATRQADELISNMKEQRVQLCHDFNTCKMTVSEYRTEQARIQGAFTALLSLKDRLRTMDSEAAKGLVTEITNIRLGLMDKKEATGPGPRPTNPNPPPSNPTTKPTNTTPPPPPPTGSGEFLPGKFMAQAMNRVASGAAAVEAKTKYGFDVEHASLLGAFLLQGKHIGMVQSFMKSHEYVLIGGGSDSAENLDIQILKDGKVIAEDRADDATPVVKFRPPEDGNYELRLVLERSRVGSSFVAVAVMRDGGYSVPTGNINKSFGAVLGGASAISAKAGRSLGGIVFHEQGNWAFFGGVLKPGIQNNFSGFKMVNDPTIVLAGGDDQATSIGLYADEDDTKREVAREKDKTTTPLLVIHPDAQKRYSLHVQHLDGKGPAMVSMVVLDALGK